MKATLITLSLGALLTQTSMAYESTYERIEWEQRGNDSYYCLDITDENWRVYPELRALACGDDLYSFSPQAFVRRIFNTDLPAGSRFNWRVWSPSGYGQPGFEGQVMVGGCQGLPYASSGNVIQWGCRLEDSYYCVDIFDNNGQMLHQAAACGEGLHHYSPAELNLGAGEYQWKVWSPSLSDYTQMEADFSGQFSLSAPASPVGQGADLYAQHCAACHGNDPQTQGRSGIDKATDPNRTRAAIRGNDGGMGYLDFLTDQNLSDIAAFVQNPQGMANIDVSSSSDSNGDEHSDGDDHDDWDDDNDHDDDDHESDDDDDDDHDRDDD